MDYTHNQEIFIHIINNFKFKKLKQLNSDLNFFVNMINCIRLKRQLLTGQVRKSREAQAYRAENGGQ